MSPKGLTVPTCWSGIVTAFTLTIPAKKQLHPVAEPSEPVSCMMYCTGLPKTPCPQANTRIASGSSNGSLLKQWITKIVAGYASKVTWPLQSLKLDDQLAFAKVRTRNRPGS